MHMQRLSWVAFVRIEKVTESFVAKYSWHGYTALEWLKPVDPFLQIVWECVRVSVRQSPIALFRGFIFFHLFYSKVQEKQGMLMVMALQGRQQYHRCVACSRMKFLHKKTN